MNTPKPSFAELYAPTLLISAEKLSFRAPCVLLIVNVVVKRASKARSISLKGVAIPLFGCANTTEISSQKVPLSANPETFK